MKVWKPALRLSMAGLLTLAPIDIPTIRAASPEQQQKLEVDQIDCPEGRCPGLDPDHVEPTETDAGQAARTKETEDQPAVDEAEAYLGYGYPGHGYPYHGLPYYPYPSLDEQPESADATGQQTAEADLNLPEPPPIDSASATAPAPAAAENEPAYDEYDYEQYSYDEEAFTGAYGEDDRHQEASAGAGQQYEDYSYSRDYEDAYDYEAEYGEYRYDDDYGYSGPPEPAVDEQEAGAEYDYEGYLYGDEADRQELDLADDGYGEAGYNEEYCYDDGLSEADAPQTHATATATDEDGFGDEESFCDEEAYFGCDYGQADGRPMEGAPPEPSVAIATDEEETEAQQDDAGLYETDYDYSYEYGYDEFGRPLESRDTQAAAEAPAEQAAAETVADDAISLPGEEGFYDYDDPYAEWYQEDLALEDADMANPGAGIGRWLQIQAAKLSLQATGERVAATVDQISADLIETAQQRWDLSVLETPVPTTDLKRQVLLELADVLDRAGQSLQQASRNLVRLADAQTAEIRFAQEDETIR